MKKTDLMMILYYAMQAHHQYKSRQPEADWALLDRHWHEWYAKWLIENEENFARHNAADLAEKLKKYNGRYLQSNQEKTWYQFYSEQFLENK